ncbi:MAG: class II aldolase/adducin family protein [Chroococcidiopsidaceae cyanobacterium CP_BM_RX_35]|nr:class II aldolase/adducin family protein [Chroococcidiopsidaceae cyanobacterium CP_BM_RX_35]
MIDEGYIKYRCRWIHSKPLHVDEIIEINKWRNKLHQLGLIGQYNNGISFGNISIRYKQAGKFIISGTQTGLLLCLTPFHYTLVTDVDIDKNCLTCQGPIKASSESLTHAAIYNASSAVNAVIHVHHLELWKRLMNKVPTSSVDLSYGTPEIAKEIIRFFKEDNLIEEKILVMGGHEEGIISIGRNLSEAGEILLKYYNANIGAAVGS